MSLAALAEGLGWLLAGALLGALYLLLVGRTVAAMAPPASRAAAAGWFALRLAMAAAAFWVAAQQGPLPLVLMLAGFVLVRTLVLRRIDGG